MDTKTFRELSALWKEEKRQYVKQSTMSVYILILENHLLPIFGEATKIDEADVQCFVMRKLSDGLSQKSIKDMLIVLKMVVRHGIKFCNWQHADWCIKFPTEQTSNSLPVLNIVHQRKLMKYVTDNFTFRNLGILICLNTGMRIGEVCALTWGDVDIKQGVIHVNKTLERIYIIDGDSKHTELIISTPKTRNSNREIPITKSLLKVLKPLKAIVSDSFYVLTNDENPTEPRTYRNYYKQLLHRLDIPALKFHGLRHSFATRCIESQCDYKTVSVILGHANISTTLNLYVHPNLDQKKRCLDKMSKSLDRL
jgi:site-specific recombinase XerD